MKAVQFSRYGGPEVIETGDVPIPSIKDNQVLVEVHAASLNPIDWKLRRGYLQEVFQPAMPVTLGGDFTGLVVNTGSKVTDLNAGDQVYGQAIVMNGGSGSLAEFVACNRQNLNYKPPVYFYEAAALPLAGVSALQSLAEQIQLKKGQKILIHGGAGGIGSLAIQLAKTMQAFVATTVSAKDIDFVKKLGADLAIDYKTQRFEEIIQDYDAVFDTVGKDTYRRSFAVLKKGGIINSMVHPVDDELARQFEVKALYQSTITNAKRLSRLSEYVGSDKLKPVIDREFSIDNAREAFEYFENEHSRGKVIVKI